MKSAPPAFAAKKLVPKPKLTAKPNTVKPAIAPRKSTRKLPVICVLLALLVTGGGLIIYHRHQQAAASARALAADRAKFAGIERDMDYTAKLMKNDLQDPESNKSTDCSRTSLKFQEGQAGCSVTYTFTYKLNSYDNALQMENTLYETALHTGLYEKTDSSPNNLIPGKNTQIYAQKQGVSVDIKPKQASRCTISLDSFLTNDGVRDSVTSSLKAANYRFGCYSDVTEPIYPLAE